jgi:Uma2 family endonuclease
LIVLQLSAEQELGDRALVTSDQFLYWDPTDPQKCLAPDLAVRIGAPPGLPPTWKTWELGAPHVGVEIVSDWDRSQGKFEKKLARYRQAGILEVVRFDAESRKEPLRLWDLFDGDLVERDPTDPKALLSDALGLYWCIRVDPTLGPMLRLAHDPAGKDLVLTPEEAALAAKDAALAAKDAALAAKDAALAAKDAALAANDAALARIAELEAELAARR